MEQKQALKTRIAGMETGETMVLGKEHECSARVYASELCYFGERRYTVNRNRAAGTVTITRVR